MSKEFSELLSDGVIELREAGHRVTGIAMSVDAFRELRKAVPMNSKNPKCLDVPVHVDRSLIGTAARVIFTHGVVPGLTRSKVIAI